MTVSWNEGLATLIRLLSREHERQHTDVESRLNLTAEELRALRRQQLEQEQARENLRSSMTQHRPFNGVL